MTEADATGDARPGEKDTAGEDGGHTAAPEAGERPGEQKAGEQETGDDGIAGAAVRAEELGLDGPHGPVFRDVTFELPAGALGAIQGPSGTGRTCLLLALTGRMKPRRGQAQVGRHRLPRQMAAARRISALGPVAGVTDLDPALTVAEHLRERVLLQQRFGDSLRGLLRPRRERAAARSALTDGALEAAGLDLATLPKGPRTRAQDLERLEALRLSVAMALMSRPRLLAVDDLDLKLSDEERGQAWELLHSVGRRGTTVLAVCSEAPADAVVIRTERVAGATEQEKDARADGEETTAGRTGGKTKGEAADALAEAGRA